MASGWVYQIQIKAAGTWRTIYGVRNRQSAELKARSERVVGNRPVRVRRVPKVKSERGGPITPSTSPSR